MNSSTTTEGGNSSAVFAPGGNMEQEILVANRLTESVSMLVPLAHACRARFVLIHREMLTKA